MMQRLESALLRLMRFRQLHPDIEPAGVEELYRTLRELSFGQQARIVPPAPATETEGVVAPLELLALNAFSRLDGRQTHH